MKKLLACLIIISLCPAFGFAASSQNTKKPEANATAELAKQTLILNEAFKAALIRSEVLANQQEVVAQAEEEYKRAWGSILPTVSAAYSNLQTDGRPSNTQTSRITAEQPLFRGFRNFAAIESTKSTITAQKQAKEWAGMQLYRDVAAAYYTYLAAQKDLHVLDNELDLYTKRTKELDDRLKIGRSRPTEVLTVKSARAILKAQREQVLGQLYVAKEVLAFLTGISGELKLEDNNSVPTDIESLDSYQARISSRPDVLAARKNVDAAKSNITIAKGGHLPSVDLIGNYYTQHPETRTSGDWDAQLSVTMPIFSGGITSSNVRTAQSQKRQSELQLSQIERLAKQDVRSLHYNLTSSLAQVKALQEAFDVSQENYRANVKDYEFALVTNLDVLQALSSYQETQRALEKAKYLSNINYNQLEAAVASRLNLMRSAEKP